MQWTDYLLPNPGLPIGPDRAAFDYDLRAGRQMIKKTAQFMARDLKRSLGRGYSVTVKRTGDAIPSRSWLWNVSATLAVSSPDGRETDVEIRLNIAEGESSGWFKTSDQSGIVSVPRALTADQEWEYIRNEISYLLKR